MLLDSKQEFKLKSLLDGWDIVVWMLCYILQLQKEFDTENFATLEVAEMFKKDCIVAKEPSLNGVMSKLRLEIINLEDKKKAQKFNR